MHIGHKKEMQGPIVIDRGRKPIPQRLKLVFTWTVPDGLELNYDTTEGGRFHVGFIAFNGTDVLDVEVFDKNDDRIGGSLRIPYTAFEQSFTTF